MNLASPPPPVEAAIATPPTQDENDSYKVDPIHPNGISCNEVNNNVNTIQSAPIVEPATIINHDNNNNNNKEAAMLLPLSVEGLRYAATKSHDSSHYYYEGYCVVLARAPPPNCIQLLLPCLYGDRNYLSYNEGKKYIVVTHQQIYVFNDIIDPTPFYTIPLLPNYTIQREDPKQLHPNSYTISPIPNTNQQPATMISILLISTPTSKAKTVLLYQFTFDLSSSLSHTNNELKENEDNDAQRFLSVIQSILQEKL